jgi:hypothetical protein
MRSSRSVSGALRAHANVVDLNEGRRLREKPVLVADDAGNVIFTTAPGDLLFVEYQSAPSKTSPEAPKSRAGWRRWFGGRRDA